MRMQAPQASISNAMEEAPTNGDMRRLGRKVNDRTVVVEQSLHSHSEIRNEYDNKRKIETIPHLKANVSWFSCRVMPELTLAM